MIWILWGYLIIAHVGFVGVAVMIARTPNYRYDVMEYIVGYVLCLIWPVSLVVAFKGGVV
jgi:hypothetical protein